MIKIIIIVIIFINIDIIITFIINSSIPLRFRD